jgi:uncharacterized alpha-E superfamily protein
MQEPLNELRAHLQAEIDKAEAGHPDHAELTRLQAELDRRLEEDDDEGIVDDLRERVQRWEVSHPALADVIGRTADALSAIGL